MKLTVVLALVAAATVVSAETNAQRFARGFPPKAPGKRATPVSNARRSSPSGTSQCNTGSMHCCNSVTTTKDNSSLTKLLHSLGVGTVSSDTLIGLSCSPMTGVGSGGNTCTQQPVCCTDNKYNGIVNVGCSPININL